MKKISITIGILALWFLFPSYTHAGTSDFLQAAGDETDATEYTFSAQSLGVAVSDRYILVFVMVRSTAANTVNAVTVGGVAATLLDNTISGLTKVGSFIAAVPTGATGDIVITLNDTGVRISYAAYRLTGLLSATPADSLISVAEPPSGGIDVSSDGVIVGFLGSVFTSGWTNLTEEFDGNFGTTNAYIGGGHNDYTSAQTVTVSNDTTEASLVMSIWSFDFTVAGGATRKRVVIFEN